MSHGRHSARRELTLRNWHRKSIGEGIPPQFSGEGFVSTAWGMGSISGRWCKILQAALPKKKKKVNRVIPQSVRTCKGTSSRVSHQISSQKATVQTSRIVYIPDGQWHYLKENCSEFNLFKYYKIEYSYIYIYTHTHIEREYISVYIYIHIHTHTHIHVHTYIYTHIYLIFIVSCQNFRN